MIGFGQDDIIKLQADVDNINFRMEKHHKQFYNGVSLNFVGLGVSVIGALISVNPLIFVGSAICLSGSIVTIDSHKWFKKKNNQIYYREKNSIKKDNLSKDDKIKKRINQLNELLRKGSINEEEYDDAIKSLDQLKQ